MTSAERLDAIRDCLRTVLQLDPSDAQQITADATPLQLPGWSSLAQVRLVIELERRFDVTFDADEIAGLASVAAILQALERRTVTG